MKRERGMFQNKNAASKSQKSPHLSQHVLFRSTDDE